MADKPTGRTGEVTWRDEVNELKEQVQALQDLADIDRKTIKRLEDETRSLRNDLRQIRGEINTFMRNGRFPME
jgi:chromosome segregation ATPase